MRKYSIFALAVLILYGCTGCGPSMALLNHLNSYTFTASGDLERLAGMSDISNLIYISSRCTNEERTLIQGQLLALFGNAAYITPDLNKAYVYSIAAENKQGEVSYLRVFIGPAGPAIGWDPSQKEGRKAAKALKQYIRRAEPADYEYTGYHLNTSSKLIQKIKDGKVSWEEKILSEREFMDALQLCLPEATADSPK